MNLSADSAAELEARCLARPWFYPFRLASGAFTQTYVTPEVAKIHDTRLRMLQAGIAAHFGDPLPTGLTAVDLACHEGWFSQQVSALGFTGVLGLDARADHVADAALVARACGAGTLEFRQADVHALDADALGRFDLVLCLGLIYHLENPVGALRVARSLTAPGGLCLVETQVVPNLAGPVDWGSYRFVKPLMGIFGLIDETDETHGPEMSTTGICLAPSVEGLLWIMRKVGFADVRLVTPPPDAYEQHRYGKRVMVIGRV